MAFYADRRTILALSSAAALCGGASNTYAQTLRQRARVFGPQRPSALDTYKLAVTEMMAKPPSDPRNWYRQALLHVLDCPHQNWWFLPWHRGFLHQFEQICADAARTPSFALPYWDWTASPSVPDAFFDPEFDTSNTQRFVQTWNEFETKLIPAVQALWQAITPPQREQMTRRGYDTLDALINGPLGLAAHFGVGMRRALSRQHPNLPNWAASEVRVSDIRADLSPTTFGGFAGIPTSNHHEMVGERALESGPHDNVHGAVGGIMSAWLSPIDPLFWLHHANLDRLWDVWIRARLRRNENPLPHQQAERDRLLQEPYLFFTDASGQPIARTAADYMMSTPLGYTYEAGSAEQEFIASLPPQQAGGAAQGNVFSTGRIDERFRVNRESSARIDVGENVLRSVVVERTDTNLFARIVIEPPSDPGAVRFRVYLNCPYLSVHTPVEDNHYVGTITPFTAPGAGMTQHEHHGHELVYTFALNPALERLSASGSLPRSALRVQLIAETRAGEDASVMTGGIREIAIEEH